MAARTHHERVSDRLFRTADLLVQLAEEAGRSKSPSQVRHEIAAAINEACSQSTVQRLHLALEHKVAQCTPR